MTCAACDEVFEICVEQGGTVLYSATLTKVDPSDPTAHIPVELVELQALELRLTNEVGEVINDRDAVSILNVNGGTFHATSGLMTMQFNEDDNAITDEAAARRREAHIATFRAVWATGSKHWQVRISVDNLDLVAGSAWDS